jgi:hypothetical protein
MHDPDPLAHRGGHRRVTQRPVQRGSSQIPDLRRHAQHDVQHAALVDLRAAIVPGAGA